MKPPSNRAPAGRYRRARHEPGQGRPAAPTVDEVVNQAVRQHGPRGLHAETLGATYESMLDRARRLHEGLIYTPGPLAEFTTGIVLADVLRRLDGPEPAQILRITVLDPACGTGILLVHAARVLARAYAARLTGAEPTAELAAAVLPTVILTCCFGIDKDPIATELAKLSLSLDTGGVLPVHALDRHIVTADTLSDPDVHPPAWQDKHETTDTVDVPRRERGTRSC